MRTLLFIVSAIISLSVFFLEDVIAQSRRDFTYDLPAIPTPGQKEQPPAKTEPSEIPNVPEGECDRKKNNSLACRRDVFQGKQVRLVDLTREERKLFGTWTIRTAVTMTDEATPKEIEINPAETPISGLKFEGASVSSVSDIPRSNRVFEDGRAYRVRSDGVTVDFYLSGENVPEMAFVCRMVRFQQSGDNLVCIYHEAPAGPVGAETKYVAKGYLTLTRVPQRRRQPEVATDPDDRQPPRYDYRGDYRRRNPYSLW